MKSQCLSRPDLGRHTVTSATLSIHYKQVTKCNPHLRGGE